MVSPSPEEKLSVYSQAEAHLTILDNCTGSSMRRAYLVLLLAAERTGWQCTARQTGRELLIRDRAGRQFFTAALTPDALLFSLLRPALDEGPQLAAQALDRFYGRVRGAPGSSEVHIRIANEQDAEDLVDWLFPGGNFSLGYEARRSA